MEIPGALPAAGSLLREQPDKCSPLWRRSAPLSDLSPGTVLRDQGSKVFRYYPRPVSGSTHLVSSQTLALSPFFSGQG